MFSVKVISSCTKSESINILFFTVAVVFIIVILGGQSKKQIMIMFLSGQLPKTNALLRGMAYHHKWSFGRGPYKKMKTTFFLQ
jgi:hypothetical protein